MFVQWQGLESSGIPYMFCTTDKGACLKLNKGEVVVYAIRRMSLFICKGSKMVALQQGFVERTKGHVDSVTTVKWWRICECGVLDGVRVI